VAIREDLLRTFVAPHVLAMPERLVDSAWLGHVPFAAWLVSAHRPALTVELGVHNGASLCAMIQASKAIGHHADFVGIDHWMGDEHAGQYGGDVFWNLMAFHEERHRDLSRLLRCTFDQGLDHVRDGSVDLIHIDGFHSYEAVRHDYESWRPKMGPRGVMIFHDTSERQEGFGVWRFWDEVAAEFPSFAFSHSHGLGVLYVGTDPVPAWMAALAEAQRTSEGDGIRAYFNALGDAVANRRQLDLSREDAGRAWAEAGAQRARADGIHSASDTVRRSLDGANSVVASLSRRIESLSIRVHEGDRAKADLEAANAEKARLTLENEGMSVRLDHANEALRQETEARAEIEERLSQFVKPRRDGEDGGLLGMLGLQRKAG
jgi:hypothetical protein